jgi:hypothetical protein
VLDGKVGVAAARDLYGVVLSADPPTVDAARTAERRASLRSQSG